MPKWEYRVLTIDIESQKHKDGRHETEKERDNRIENSLGEMGKDGWELVSFVPAVVIVKSINPWLYHAVLKRPIS
jgi:hypothetical protein